jgi:RNA recognition motif-containing protein
MCRLIVSTICTTHPIFFKILLIDRRRLNLVAKFFYKLEIDSYTVRLISSNPNRNLVSVTSDEDAKLVERSKTMILVKNSPHDTTKEDLVKVFSGAGDSPSRILLPPSRTIAVVEYSHPNDAKRSFRKLAY